jgi:chorismate mutase
MTGTATTPETSGPPVAADIPAARERIDEIDAEIVRLVRQRAEVSREIQAARLAAGGRRVEYAREVEIVRRYNSALGNPGTSVAMALLEVCRGSGR